MLLQTEYQKIVDISTSVINKYSKNWNKCIVFTGYCHNSYNGVSLTYQDSESKSLNYWGDLYSNIADDEMYSFEGYQYINELLKKYYIFCQNDKKLRWNEGRITIYPDGHYEESFIWNNDIYLRRLKSDVEGFVSDIYHQAYERIEDKCLMLSIPFNFQTEVIASFTAGSANPVLFITPNKPEMTFSLYLEQMYFYIDKDYSEAFEEYGKIRKKVTGDWLTDLENWYFAMNEGELKGHYPRWNVARFLIDPKADYIGFDEVKLEWREDLT